LRILFDAFVRFDANRKWTLVREGRGEGKGVRGFAVLARAHELHGVQGLAGEGLQLRFEVMRGGVQRDGHVARPFRTAHLLHL
jgi:hypothetical protein